MSRSLSIEIQHVDAVQFEADVLALKHAQGFWGLDKAIAGLLMREGHQELLNDPPPEGQFRFLQSHGTVRAQYLLFVGIHSINRFSYASVRELGYRFLSSLVGQRVDIMHLAMTLHGAGFGLEPDEAFRAELLGLVDAYGKGEYPSSLERISFLERNASLAAMLRVELEDLRSNHPTVQKALNLPTRLEEVDHSKQVFISYSRDDESLALQIADDLIGKQLPVWIDQIAIQPGQHWDKVVQEALQASSIMILILSPTSVHSDNVADEYHYFIQNDKTIIPVLTTDFEMAEMPFRLSRRQYIDLKDDYRAALETLVNTVKQVMSA